MTRELLLILILAVLFSCKDKNRFPEKVTEMTATNPEIINAKLMSDSNPALIWLNNLVDKYNTRDPGFNLADLQKKWSTVSNINEFSKTEKKCWIKATELLFELTGDARYAEQLEKSEADLKDIPDALKGFVVTKYVDHLHVNLFRPSEINYQHTLGGEVVFSIDTNYPESGSVKLHFKVSGKKYIELFVRIPSWAQGTTVTVKGVKYVAPPGDYCKIAKQWKDGDLVEIEFPENKMSTIPVARN